MDYLDQLKEELATEFDGVTAFVQAPAEGVWKEGSRNSHDQIVIFEVMSEDLDINAWRQRRSELEIRFRQQHVVIRHITIGVI